MNTHTRAGHVIAFLLKLCVSSILLKAATAFAQTATPTPFCHPAPDRLQPCGRPTPLNTVTIGSCNDLNGYVASVSNRHIVVDIPNVSMCNITEGITQVAALRASAEV